LIILDSWFPLSIRDEFRRNDNARQCRGLTGIEAPGRKASEQTPGKVIPDSGGGIIRNPPVKLGAKYLDSASSAE